MADKIVSIYPAPSGTQLVYLNDGVDFLKEGQFWGNSFKLVDCHFIALVEKGKEQRVVGLDLNPQTGNLEIPDGPDYMGIVMYESDTQVLEAYYEVAKERQK